jgi:hypothetical protein
MMPKSRVVKIIIEHSDGTIEWASGNRADVIWKQLMDALAFCSIHGNPYSGPKFDVIDPDNGESTQNVLGG